jgi:protein-L-isoaspartate(D-aspartate) O-methyltransferase
MVKNDLQNLIKRLEDRGVLKSAKIKKALFDVDRIGFVPKKLNDAAYLDKPLQLADGQTISQPTTVVFMLEFLDVLPGKKVLDIGAGSGWVSCLLANLVGRAGEVYAYEINQKVGAMGLKNVRDCRTENLKYFIADAADKWKDDAPYDRIHSGAAFCEIPQDLLRNLKIGGILVAPTQDGYVKKIKRIGEDEFKIEERFGFTFVPFISRSL